MPKSFDQILEQDLKDDIVQAVLSADSDNDLIDGFITQADIDKAEALPDDDDESESEKEFKQEV